MGEDLRLGQYDGLFFDYETRTWYKKYVGIQFNQAYGRHHEITAGNNDADSPD